METFALFYLRQPLRRKISPEVSILRSFFLNDKKQVLVQLAIFEDVLKPAGSRSLYPIQVIALFAIDPNSETIWCYQLDTLCPDEFHSLTLLSKGNDQVVYYHFVTTENETSGTIGIEVKGVREVIEKEGEARTLYEFRKSQYRLTLSVTSQ